VYDEESGLSWTRFRCFDAETGRWLSADPLGLAGGLETFGFDGNPTEAIDPLGLSCRRNNFLRQVNENDLRDAPAWGPQGKIGHASEHNVPKSRQVDVLNSPERIFSGINANTHNGGRPVDVYYKDGSAVITEAGDKTSVITAYGNISKRKGDKPVPPSRWDGSKAWEGPNERYVEVVAKPDRPPEIIHPDKKSWDDDWY
jgi:uncharacterized protein RhaS with RHS repeats